MNVIAKSGLRFLLAFLLVYGVLMAISMTGPVASASNAIYRKASHPIIQSLLPKAYMHFKEGKESAGIIRVEYISKEKLDRQVNQQRTPGSKKVSVTGYDYEIFFHRVFLSLFVFFLSLMLLSPIRRKEKLIGILVGGLVLFAFSLLKIYLLLMTVFNDAQVAVYESSEATMNVVNGILTHFTLSVSLLMIVVLWLFFAFRKGNWNGFLDQKFWLWPKKRASKTAQ